MLSPLLQLLAHRLFQISQMCNLGCSKFSIMPPGMFPQNSSKRTGIFEVRTLRISFLSFIPLGLHISAMISKLSQALFERLHHHFYCNFPYHAAVTYTFTVSISKGWDPFNWAVVLHLGVIAFYYCREFQPISF